MSKEMSEQWAKAMERKGFMHNGRPSVSRLAGATPLATETVRRMVLGIGEPEQRNVNHVADALGVSRIELNRWIGIARTVEETYEPPADADLMDREQRHVVDRVIQLFVADKKAGERHGSAAAKTEPDAPTLRAVASGDQNQPQEAEQADREAAEARAKQEAAIREMEEKKRKK